MRLGVKKMITVGEKLDPSKHEALLAGPGEKDIITEEFEAGYTFHDENTWGRSWFWAVWICNF